MQSCKDNRKRSSHWIHEICSSHPSFRSVMGKFCLFSLPNALTSISPSFTWNWTQKSYFLSCLISWKAIDWFTPYTYGVSTLFVWIYHTKHPPEGLPRADDKSCGDIPESSCKWEYKTVRAEYRPMRQCCWVDSGNCGSSFAQLHPLRILFEIMLQEVEIDMLKWITSRNKVLRNYKRLKAVKPALS